MLEHNFTGPPFTIGVEEELMILDPDGWGLAQAIEPLLAGVPEQYEGQVKPELMKSVLEIATTPCADVGEVRAQLGELRNAVIGIAEGLGLAIGASATHPFALAADQEITDSPRYREPRPRSDRGRRQGDLRRRRDPPLPAAAARALDQLAVLAGRAHRPDVVAGPGLPRLPA